MIMMTDGSTSENVAVSAPGSPAAQDIQALAGRLQRVRLNMADWLAPRDVLQAPHTAF